MRLGPALLIQTALFVTALCAAQDKAAFEVASIKPNAGGPESGFSIDIAPSGRFTARNLDIWNLIRLAYGLRDLQMSGGPTWIKNRRFDIQAEPAQNTMPALREKVLRMIQSLLEDRFRLKWHRESREGPAYGLSVADRGPKLPLAREGRGSTKFGDLDAPSMTLESLCQILEFELDRPVLNRTGFSDPFAIHLQWASERAVAPELRDPSRPSLFTAVQEQLGLKLESIRAPTEFFVIDGIDAPSEN